MSNGTSEQYRSFLRNGDRLGLSVDKDLLVVGDSAELSPQDVLDKVGKVRFFSIDGGHTLANLEADCRLAKRRSPIMAS